MSGVQKASNLVTKEDGTRVIAASRRPDGTWRKEKKVRDGYVPQDEQPVYQSRGRQMTWKPPRSRHPNLQKKMLPGRQRRQSCIREPPTDSSAEADLKAALEKKIRNLKKKIRQCESIQVKLNEGRELTPEEQIKLDNMTLWDSEVRDLEQQLSSLT